MNFNFPPEMLEATRLTRAGRVGEATSLLRRLLNREEATGEAPPNAAARLEPPQLDLTPDEVRVSAPLCDADVLSPESEGPHPQGPAPTPLPNMLRNLVG